MKLNRLSSVAAASTLLSGYLLQGDAQQKQEKLNWYLHTAARPLLNRQPVCEALVQPEDRKRLYSIKTNAYVWGEGYQVDPTQDYSNFTPKKIQQFKGADAPNVVDVAFGWYHEAYVDQAGQLYVCAKSKLSSIEVEGVRDGDRADLHKVANLPRGTKVKQASFTQNRLFVLSESGEVFLYKVVEHFPKREDVELFGQRAGGQIRGELMVNDAPVKIKDLGKITQIACGLDHVLFLNDKGELLAMGDDTFG